jgi:hypothetical protein
VRTNNLFPAFLALSACAFFHCTTMNMPVHNIMYPRDINSQWVQMASLDVSGIHLDTNQRPSGINTASVNLYYVNYVLPALGVGARVSAYEPFKTLAPNHETGGDAWWTYHTYVIPVSFIISARLIHVKYFTYGFAIYPFSWPFIIGSASMIGTFHLPLNIDINANLHCNPTLWYVLDNKSNYGYFNEYDIGVAQSIRVGQGSDRIFYSISLQSYRGIYERDNANYAMRPDLRFGISLGYVFGSSVRRFGVIRGESGWPFTWPQPGYKTWR